MSLTTYSKDEKFVIVMVGLPARGKSFIANKLIHYLNWLTIDCKSFQVSQYRETMGIKNPSLQFFNSSIDSNLQLRERARIMAFNDMRHWLDENSGIRVAILDSSNITKLSRDNLQKDCKQLGYNILFIESYCDPNHNIIEYTINEIAKSTNCEDLEKFKLEYKAKIKLYEDRYESIDSEKDNEKSFVKLTNINESLLINKIENYLMSKIIFFIINLNVKPKYIWLSRHGESQFNLHGKIGGDSSLSQRGERYAKQLNSMLRQHLDQTTYNNLKVWTSTLIRTNETATFLPHDKLPWKALDELDAGLCDGMTYEEIESKFPDDFKARDTDKFRYRYRGGESYQDVVNRLEPIIMELERQDNIFIVTHQAVLRCIYAYFMNVPPDRSPWLSIPLHTLIRLKITAMGTEVKLYKADIPAVSTYKDKGTSHVGEIDDSSIKI